jgi:hypothetical protein
MSFFRDASEPTALQFFDGAPDITRRDLQAEPPQANVSLQKITPVYNPGAGLGVRNVGALTQHPVGVGLDNLADHGIGRLQRSNGSECQQERAQHIASQTPVRAVIQDVVENNAGPRGIVVLEALTRFPELPTRDRPSSSEVFWIVSHNVSLSVSSSTPRGSVAALHHRRLTFSPMYNIRRASISSPD